MELKALRPVSLGFLAVALVLVTGCPPPSGPAGPTTATPQRPRPPALRDVWPPRAVWVVRQVYASPEQIAALMENCRQAGLNTVLFQVRGNGTAFHRSNIEPPATEYGGRMPAFDQLEVACDEAHRRGLALHAWVNVMPAWKGRTPPADPRQLYNARPEWFWYDQDGKRQPLDDFYVSLNPCLPEVRAYLVEVMREIVERYPVDGLHLDYIRFPNENCKGRDYPRDARTLSLYRQATGKRPDDDPAAWTAWRAAQVTRLVREIRNALDGIRPGILLTAAVGPDPDHHFRYHFQDGPAWVRQRLIDCAFTMNYARDVETFKARQEAWMRAAGAGPVAPGLGLYLHDADEVSLRQLEYARLWGQGFALFSASSLFDGSPRSRRRLEALRPVLLDIRRQAVAAARRESSRHAAVPPATARPPTEARPARNPSGRPQTPAPSARPIQMRIP